MAEIRIVDKGDVFGKMRFLKGFPRTLKEPTVKATILLKDAMREYPSPPPTSTYTRTFRLRNSWRRRTIVRGRILGRVFSDHPDYNEFVQARKTQAAVHQGRWQTIESVAEDSEQEILGIYDDFIQSRLND